MQVRSHLGTGTLLVTTLDGATDNDSGAHELPVEPLVA